MSGNEQILKLLGEFELEQKKRDLERRRESLPDLIKYPNYGYPPGDPRVLLMDRNKVVMASDVIKFCRLFADFAKRRPGGTWMDCMKDIGELYRVDVFEYSAGHRPEAWEELLEKMKI